MSYKTNIVPTVIKSNKWPENTVLITGDSILHNIQENRLNKIVNVKVRCFSGSGYRWYVRFHYSVSPRYIILHIGTNDAIDKSSTDIPNGILKLKLFIENKLPSVEVYFSCPVLRLDNSKTRLTIHHLTIKMRSLNNIPIIFHENINTVKRE